jgi:dihydrofolate reductase
VSSPIRLYMSMSLDGFIAGPDDQLARRPDVGWPERQLFREVMATGAVISGRRTFELAGRWNGDHHDGVPIFVLTHHVDDGDIPPGIAQFVSDVADCATRARAAAGDRAVVVHGASAAQALLRAGQLDEMEIHLVQVLLGEGRRLFEALGRDHTELELIRRVTARDVTHLRYRVLR